MRISMGTFGPVFSRLLLLAWIAWPAAACAPKQRILIPPEWQTGAGAVEQPREQTPGSAAATGPAGPAIEEQNLPPARPEDAASPGEPAVDQSPQTIASMHLVEQGERNLQQGALDGAIALFEQAIQIDVYNADAFYGLANAWYRKDAPTRALEFARKAEILLQDRPAKLKRVYLLEAEILEGMDNWQKAAVYRLKADRM